VHAKQRSPRATVRSLLREALPDRLADTLAERLGLGRPLANATDAALRQIEAKLADWRFRPNGSEGFAKAEVTVGGVSTAELSSKSMEAKRMGGLYVIGEAVDVTGWLGGYNFQWAWASGWAAGQAI
jgi:predicted Rossmann fold flavoprotein